MRYRIFIALLLYSGLCVAQADTVFVLGAAFGAYTAPTDSTFQIASIHPTDQLGQAFTAAKIQIGYRLIDAYGRLYRVKTVDATGIGSSTLTVVELQNSAAPSGSGIVFRSPTNSDCIPEIQAGNVGISPIVAAKIANHNAVNGCSLGEVTLTILADSTAAVRADVGAGGGITGSLTDTYMPIADATGNLEDSRIQYVGTNYEVEAGSGISILDGIYKGAISTTNDPFMELYNSVGTKVFDIIAAGTPGDGTFKFYTSNGVEAIKIRAAGGISISTTGGTIEDRTKFPANFFTDGYITSSAFSLNRNSGGMANYNPVYGLEVNTEDAILIARGTTGERPSGVEALFRYNETLDRFEGHDNVGYNSFAYLTDLATALTPTGTADATGDEGDIAYDDDYIYVKTSAGWKRAALSTF